MTRGLRITCQTLTMICGHKTNHLCTLSAKVTSLNSLSQLIHKARTWWWTTPRHWLMEVCCLVFRKCTWHIRVKTTSRILFPIVSNTGSSWPSQIEERFQLKLRGLLKTSSLRNKMSKLNLASLKIKTINLQIRNNWKAKKSWQLRNLPQNCRFLLCINGSPFLSCLIHQDSS